MFYLVNPTSSKKRFCNNNHYWQLKFAQGTNQPHVVCFNCDHSEKVYWINGCQKFQILKSYKDEV